MGSSVRGRAATLIAAVALSTTAASCVSYKAPVVKFDNRTTIDAVIVFQTGGRWLVPACTSMDIDIGDVRQELDPSASPPAGAVAVGFYFPGIGDSPVDPIVTITATGILNGAVASETPCEGSPPASSPMR